MKRYVALFLLGAMAFTSCKYAFRKKIYGDGNIKTESRNGGTFKSVHVSGAIDVYVRQDSVTSVKIEADANLMEYIHVINEDEILRIRPENGYNLDPSKRIKVYVSSATYKNFDASGACNIYSENKIMSGENLDFDLSGSCSVNMELKAPKISADLSGACDIELKGETKEFEVGGSGSTGIKAINLLAENVNVSISGSGDAQVYASVKLDVEVSGSGSVQYKGNAQVNQSISGSGSVKKVE